MKTKILLITMATTCLMVACSSDDETMPEQKLPISVDVTENPMTNPDGTQTRTAIATAVTSPFYMVGKNTSYTVTKGSTTWSLSPDHWPIGASSTDDVLFCAYTGGEYNTGGGNPFINFTVSSDAYSQRDLLVASTTTSQSANNGRVDLTFDHACAAVYFTIAKTAKLADYTIHVSDVQLCNVNSKGNYKFSDSSWDDLSTPTSYTLNTAVDMVVTTTPKRLPSDESTDYLFLIPQVLTGWDKSGEPSNCYIKMTCNITGAKTFSGDAYIPFTLTLEKGKSYPIEISIGTGLRDGSGNKIF